MLVRWVVIVLCVVLGAGCRFGFDQVGSDAAPSGDGPPFVDAPVGDAPSTAVTTMFAPVADTYVSQDNEGVDERPNNFGGDDTLKIKAGEEHALMLFDLTSLPAGATVFTAELSLTPTDDEPDMATVEIRPLLESWTEGSLDGTPGVCNWTQRTATDAWTTDGAAPPGSAGPAATGFQTDGIALVKVVLPTSLIQPWVDDSLQNRGIVLIATLEDVDVASREATPSIRPVLSVTWIPP